MELGSLKHLGTSSLHKKESRSWLDSTFSSLIESPLNQKFLNKSQLFEYDLWVEKFSNRKGHFAEITKLQINGGLNKLILPGGIN